MEEGAGAGGGGRWQEEEEHLSILKVILLVSSVSPRYFNDLHAVINGIKEALRRRQAMQHKEP